MQSVNAFFKIEIGGDNIEREASKIQIETQNASYIITKDPITEELIVEKEDSDTIEVPFSRPGSSNKIYIK